MQTPFMFGKIATGNEFTNRESEAARLVGNFNAKTNTILISPRRWGKSSLVKKSAEMAAKGNQKLHFCFIDLFNVRNEEQFYQSLAQEVIKASTSKWEERIAATKKFMAQFIPKITYGMDIQTEFEIGLDWKEVQKLPDQIIDLPEKIAVEKKIHLVVCVDEFQNIAEFNEPLAFQKKLRAHWQGHTHVTYCLYGSKRHMMMEVFASPSMPFYKFGDLLFLEKIALEKWVSFITQRFSETGKEISETNAQLIAELAERHPYYVQQLAQITWMRSSKKCEEKDVREAHEQLVRQLSLLFQNMTDSLTSTQVNFLKAVIEGAPQLSAKETLSNYRLGTSANVLRIKEALVNKEVLDVQGSQIEFLDPIYKHWLKDVYFNARGTGATSF